MLNSQRYSILVKSFPLTSHYCQTPTLFPKSTTDLDRQMSSPGDSAKSNCLLYCGPKPILVRSTTFDGNRSSKSSSTIRGSGPSKLIPNIHQVFWLIAWLVSGNPSKQVVYQNKHVPCFWHLGGKKPTGVISRPGRYGVADVVQGEWIPLIPL